MKKYERPSVWVICDTVRHLLYVLFVLLLQDSRVLHCYNAHNDYVITLKAYNEVCSSVVETHHPYLLDVSGYCHGDVDHVITPYYRTCRVSIMTSPDVWPVL